MIRVDDRDGVKWFVVTDENGQAVEWVPGRFGVLIAHEVEQLQQRLAAAEAACDTTSQQVSNLVMLVGRLVHQVRKYDETNDVAEKAMDYLRRKDLMPSILRGVGGESAKGGRDE